MHTLMDFVRGELERLLDLEEMHRISSDLLAVDPKILGTGAGKAAFARTLVESCAAQDSLQALGDALLFTSKDADPRLRDLGDPELDDEIAIGTQIGDLRVVKKLGEGGLGVAYLARLQGENEDSGRILLKIIRRRFARDRAAVARFLATIRAIRSVHAPALAPYYEIGILENGRPWVTYEYQAAQNLSERLERSGGMHFKEAQSVIRDVLKALAALHEHRLVHGDVKTENVFVTRKTDEQSSRPELRAVIVDAGMTRIMVPARGNAGTSGLLSLLGTPKAIAPERARGDEHDPRSDLYAVGALMYEMLTGRPLYMGESAMDIVAQHLWTEPEKPSAFAQRGWIGPELDEVVLRALAKDPDSRYQSAKEMLEAIEEVGEPIRAYTPLDRDAFEGARDALYRDPGNERIANTIEQEGRRSGAWPQATDVLEHAVEFAKTKDAKLALLFRLARIYETETKNSQQAEVAYDAVLKIDPGNRVALSGLENCKRNSGDAEGLVGLLLDRVENERLSSARAGILREIGSLYEEKLKDPNNAFTAWLQALVENPSDERTVKEVERLAAANPDRWNEAAETLSSAAQEVHNTLYPPFDAQAAADAAKAEAQLSSAEEAHRARQAAEQNLEWQTHNLNTLQEQLTDVKRRAEELEETSQDRAREADEVRRDADDAGQQARQAEAAADAVSPQALEQIRQHAQLLDGHAQQAELFALQASEAVEMVRTESQALETAIAEATRAVAAATKAVHNANTDEKEAGLTEQDLLQEIDEAEESAATTVSQPHPERGLTDLVKMYVLLGRWYAERLSRPDVALPYYSQALIVDPLNDAAYEAIIDLYRTAQSWNELIGVLIQRADRAVNPAKARDYRAEAANVIARKFNDYDVALEHFNRVLSEDPLHPLASRVTEEILTEREAWRELAEKFERQLEIIPQGQKVELLNRAAELYEDRLGDVERALAKYEAVIELNPQDQTALKGLERIYLKKEDYSNLLANLREQADVASTPKQRINLLERMAAIYVDQFVDPAAAISCYEQIIQIDPINEAANTSLARLYRQVQRFDDAVTALERSAKSAEDNGQKVELLLQAVHLLTAELNKPERALSICERILAIDETQPYALDFVAHLKSTTGDLKAAFDAIERRAEGERDPLKKAELYIKAGQLLEQGGDADSALDRYKRALDIDKRSAEAAQALTRIFAERGDAHSVIGILSKQIEIEEGDLRRAELLAELGRVYQEDLADNEKAAEIFQQAIALDGNCTQAILGLGKLAFDAGNYEEASQYFESIFNRAGNMPSTEASKLYLRAGESFKYIGKNDRAVDAFKRARELARDDVEIGLRLGSLLLEVGSPQDAEAIYQEIYTESGQEMAFADRADILLQLGRAQMAGQSPLKAVETLKTACGFQPNDREVLEALTEAYEHVGDWSEVVGILQLRSRTALDRREAFDLRVRTGDVFLEKLQDTKAAAQTYVAALEMEPDNRNLLTKLMSVYSVAKDWPRLIEVILRIASMVTDQAQLAKYYKTAATIAHRELGRYDEAANYYEQALSNQAELEVTFAGLVECLTQNQDWERLERAYEACIHRVADSVSRTELARLLDARGDVLQHRLGRIEDAIRVYEEAQRFDPDNRARKQMLTDIYSREPKRFFEQIVAANRELLQADPYHIESYRVLRKTYTKVRRPDESWCVSQVLHYLKMADPEEEKFFQKYRVMGLAKIRNPISEDLWRDLVVHPLQDPGLTAILSYIQPAAIATQAQDLSRFGTDVRYKADIASDPRAICRVLEHASRAMQIRLPDVFYCPEDPGGLSFLFTYPPAIGIGHAAAGDSPQQALAFVTARHLSYLRPGHFIRQLVPTGTGLRAWLMAAIRIVMPKFPVPVALEAHVKSCNVAIEKLLTAPQREGLRSLTQKLLGATPELDMKRWLAGVDLTADRVGLVLSNDLKLATAIISASPEESSSVSTKEREHELLRYSISEEFFELRRRLGIALGG
jgi:tetratricopeptide (TPR) repeat protein